MNKDRSFALTFFCWAEILVGALGTIIVVAIVSWLLYGFHYVRKFGDSNIAGAILAVLAFLLLPCVLILIADIGLLRHKPWARIVKIGMFRVLGMLYYRVVRTGWLPAPYTVLSVFSVYVLTRPAVKQQLSGHPDSDSTA